jgi:hypothetical protein
MGKRSVAWDSIGEKFLSSDFAEMLKCVNESATHPLAATRDYDSGISQSTPNKWIGAGGGRRDWPGRGWWLALSEKVSMRQNNTGPTSKSPLG